MTLRRPTLLLPALLALAVLAGRAPDAHAQVAWDSPFLVGTETPAGWGFYVSDPTPGGGIGVMTTWRSADAPGGTGFRLGLAEDPTDDLAVFAGVDVSGRLLTADEEVPVDVVWVGGAGLGARDGVLLSFPIGVAVGRAFEAEEVWFHPYGSPRVVLDARFGGEGGSDLDLELAVDVGVDLAFDPTWTVRFGGTIGERRALAIGLSLVVL